MILKNEIIELTIDNLGAEITKLKVNGEVLSHNRDPKYWGRNAPVLFPIVGSLKDAKYTFNDKEYKMGQHGFARDSIFEVIYKDDSEVTYLLTSTEQTKEVYPFDFELKITYKLENNSYTTTYEITNPSSEDIYYQIGAHPAFKVNMNEDYKIKMENEGLFYDLRGALIGDSSEYQKIEEHVNIETFKDGALIYKPTSNKVIKLLKNDQDYITMEFDDFELIGVWAPDGKNSPFVCLEPWNGLADFHLQQTNDLTKKQYIRKLNSNNKETFSFKTIIN